MKRGSALLVALFVIAVLSVMVMAFSVEAKLQAGINVYVRERNRVGRLIDAGQALAEVVITGFKDVTEWSDGEDLDELLEDDRWIREKRALKESQCTIGPIVLDEEHPENGTIRVEIELVNSGSRAAININELYQGGDQNYRVRWEIIMRTLVGIPYDLEVEVEDEGKFPLSDLLIASWSDWRDEDDTVTGSSGGFEGECGAESKWYEEKYEDDDIDDEDKRYPRNAAVPEVHELAYVRGWKDFPSVLTGGYLYDGTPWAEDHEKDKGTEENPMLTGLETLNLFGTTGTAKINVNDCTREQLLTIPGIAPEDEDGGDDEDAEALVAAILAAKNEPPEHRDDYDETRDSWPYKDWNDLSQRVSDYDSSVELGNEASEYLIYGPDENAIFKVKIVGESMGMKREVNAECYVKDKSVRYIKWRED